MVHSSPASQAAQPVEVRAAKYDYIDTDHSRSHGKDRKSCKVRGELKNKVLRWLR